MNAPQPILQAEGINKSYGPRQVLHGVDFAVHRGKTVALMGANGAGKTTLLNILATLLTPDAGQVIYFGQPLRGNESEIRRRIGLVSHQGMLYPELTVEENLRFYAGLYSLEQAEARIDQFLDLVELKKQRRQVVRTLSRGMQQRLAIGRALLHDPQILFLDEPFTGLDRGMTGRMTALLQQLAEENKTILMTSHNLGEVSVLATQVAILHHGVFADIFDCSGLDEAALAQRYQAAMTPLGVKP
jgi:heme exporter protein A